MPKNRIHLIELFISIAELFGKRSTCERGDVGCVIVRGKQIISSGCNGPVSSMIECIGNCDLTKPCENAVHAEANAIAAAAKYGISTNGTILYCTHCPCKKCAEQIIRAGIVEVFYLNNYRNEDGLKLLQKHKIKITQYKKIPNES